MDEPNPSQAPNSGDFELFAAAPGLLAATETDAKIDENAERPKDSNKADGYKIRLCAARPMPGSQA